MADGGRKPSSSHRPFQLHWPWGTRTASRPQRPQATLRLSEWISSRDSKDNNKMEEGREGINHLTKCTWQEHQLPALQRCTGFFLELLLQYYSFWKTVNIDQAFVPCAAVTLFRWRQIPHIVQQLPNNEIIGHNHLKRNYWAKRVWRSQAIRASGSSRWLAGEII